MASLLAIYMTHAKPLERGEWRRQTLVEAARKIYALNLQNVEDEIQARSIDLLPKVLAGSQQAVRMLAALYSAGLMDTIKTFKEQLAGRNLHEDSFNRDVKSVLVGAAQDMSVIHRRSSLLVIGKTAQQVAQLILSKIRKGSCAGGGVCTAALKFSPRIAAGDSDAAREILAIHMANFQNDVGTRLQALAKVKFGLSMKLRQEAKICLVQSLEEAGIIVGEEDPRVYGKSTAEVANLLATTPASRLLGANTFARRAREVVLLFKQHSESAGKLLAAMHAAFIQGRMRDVRRTMGRRSLREKDFNAKIGRVLTKSLISSGVIASTSDSLVKGKSSQRIAQILLDHASKIHTGNSRSRVLAATLSMAKDIVANKDEAAMKLWAYYETLKELKLLARVRNLRGQTWGDDAFDVGVRSALVYVLQTIKVVSSKSSPLVKDRSPQVIAKMFSSPQVQAMCKKYAALPVVSTAQQTAKMIANGDSGPARLLLAVYQAAFRGRRAAGGSFLTPEIGQCAGLLPLAQYFTNKTGEHSYLYLKDPTNIVESSLWCSDKCKANPKCMAYNVWNGCAGSAGSHGKECGNFICTLSRVPPSGVKPDVMSRCGAWTPKPKGKFVASSGGCLGHTIEHFTTQKNGSHSAVWFSDPKNVDAADEWCQTKCRANTQCLQWTTWNGCRGAGGKSNHMCGKFECTLSDKVSTKVIANSNMKCGQFRTLPDQSFVARSQHSGVQKSGRCAGQFLDASFSVKTVEAVKDCEDVCAAMKECAAYMATKIPSGYRCTLSRKRPEKWTEKVGECSKSFKSAVYQTYQYSKHKQVPKEPEALKKWCKRQCDASLKCHAISTFSLCKPGDSSCGDAYCFLSKHKPESVKSAAPMRCAWKDEEIHADSSSRCGYWPKYAR